MTLLEAFLAIFCFLFSAYCLRLARPNRPGRRIDLPYTIVGTISAALTVLLVTILLVGEETHLVIYAFFAIATATVIAICSYILFYDPHPSTLGKKICVAMLVAFGVMLLYLVTQVH